ncbi:WD40-repeat-containing domain protein [Hyaloscypha finlandica]|nr:WD40-repeat-containing domain protein [Hyaloscypha finlandica]
MSGANAHFIAGFISRVISTTKATKAVYDAAKDAEGQPEEFRQVAARLPLIIVFLQIAEEKTQALDKTALRDLERVLKSCKAKAEALENSFQRVVRKDINKWGNRYKKILYRFGEDNVEEYLDDEILADSQVLDEVCKRLITTSFPKDGIVPSATSPQDPRSLSEQVFPSTIIKTHVYIPRILEGDLGCVTSVAFSPDGKQVVSGSQDYTVRLWDIVTGAALYTLKGHSDYVRSVAFSPNGEQVVSGADDKTVRLWDTVTGALLYTLVGHSEYVTS